MDQHVRGCRVQGYQRWEQRLSLPDQDDRHVLAAAIACTADIIVTNNIADFPSSVLAPFFVRALRPDDFVMLFADSGIVRDAAREHRASLTKPAHSTEQYLNALRQNGMNRTEDHLATGSI
jgi:hypothetical protein